MAYYDPMRDKSTLGTQIQQAGARAASGLGEFLQNNEAYKKIQSQKKDLTTLKAEYFETAKKVVAENGGDPSALSAPLENETYEAAMERIGNAALVALNNKKSPTTGTPIVPDATAPQVTDAMVSPVIAPIANQSPSNIPAVQRLEQGLSNEAQGLTYQGNVPEPINRLETGLRNELSGKTYQGDEVVGPLPYSEPLPPALQQTPIEPPPPLSTSTSAKDTPNKDPLGFDALFNATKAMYDENDRGLKIEAQLGKLSWTEYNKIKREETKQLLDMQKERSKSADAQKIEDREKRFEAWKTFVTSNYDSFKTIDPVTQKETPVTIDNFDKIAVNGERKKQFAPPNPYSGQGFGLKQDASYLAEQKYLSDIFDKTEKRARAMYNGHDEDDNPVVYDESKYLRTMKDAADISMIKALHVMDIPLAKAQAAGPQLMDAPFSYDAPTDINYPIVKDSKTGKWALSFQYPGIFEKLAKAAKVGKTAKDVLNDMKSRLPMTSGTAGVK